MGKIATRGDCNDIVSGAFSGDLNRCPRYDDIDITGEFNISGTYEPVQLVQLEDISANLPSKTITVINGITIGAETGIYMPTNTTFNIAYNRGISFSLNSNCYLMFQNNASDLYINSVRSDSGCLYYDDVTSGSSYTLTRKKVIMIKNSASRGTLTITGGVSTTISSGGKGIITVWYGSNITFTLASASASAQYQVSGGGASYTGYGTYTLVYSSIIQGGIITVSDYTSTATTKLIAFQINSMGSLFSVKSTDSSGAVIDSVDGMDDGMIYDLTVADGGGIKVQYLQDGYSYTIGSTYLSCTFLITYPSSGTIEFTLNNMDLEGYDWSELTDIFLDMSY